MPHDIVTNTINVAGIGTGFEGTVGWRLLDEDGKVVEEGGTQAGGMGVMGDFAFLVSLTGHASQKHASIVLQVFGDNPGLPDEGPDPGFDVNTLPLTVGPRLVSGYWGFVLYQVTSGDTLSKIASAQELGSTSVSAIFNANRDQLDDPNLIHPGQVLRIPLGA